MPDELRLGCHGSHVTPRNERRRPLWAAANRMREQVVRTEAALRGAVRRVHGPANIDTGPHECVTLSVGRDAAPWIGAFIEHHLTMGAKHVFFLDNASTDDSVAIASRFDRVTVLTSGLSYKRLEVGMKRWMTRRFGRSRWSLFCDTDELFDYPGSARMPLRDLLGYCEMHGYKAVTAQMLDLFSDEPFGALPPVSDDLRREYRWYDLTDILRTREIYWIRRGQVRNPEIACFFGGIRRRFFGDDCWLLTKHPLVRFDPGVEICPYDSHFVTGAPVADISAVLLHYKYVGALPERARAMVRERWHKRSAEWYGGMHGALSANSDLCLKLPTAHELTSVDQLVDEGFLVTTEQYDAWVREHAR